MAAGIAAALVVLLFLRDFTLSVMRVVVSALSSPIVAYIQVGIGLRGADRRAGRGALLGAPARRAGRRRGLALVLAPKTPTGSSPLSIRGRLESGSLVVAFVAGLALATPPVEYLAASSQFWPREQLPLGKSARRSSSPSWRFGRRGPALSYLATPAKTLAVVQRLNDWISARRRALPVVVVAAFGVLLVVTGMGKVRRLEAAEFFTPLGCDGPVQPRMFVN